MFGNGVKGKKDQATVAAPDIIYGIFPVHVEYIFRTIILLTGEMRSLGGQKPERWGRKCSVLPSSPETGLLWGFIALSKYHV